MSDPFFIDLSQYADIPLPPEIERAWAAGFFDGEGWFGINGGKYLRLAVVQTEMTTLERFQAATGGCGRFYEHGKNQPKHWSKGWSFQINALGDVTFAVNMMWPYLSAPKCGQIAAAYAKRAAYRNGWPAEFPLPQQRITDDQVRAIRRAIATGGRTQVAIAAEFGVGAAYITDIKMGRLRAKVL